MGLVGDIQGY